MISRKPAFVLIHGAWHGMPTWDNIAPLLEGQDYPARMLDLPGAGAHAQMPLAYDKRPLDSAAFATEASPGASSTQDQRTRAVIALVKKKASETGGPVTLLGHSLAALP